MREWRRSRNLVVSKCSPLRGGTSSWHAIRHAPMNRSTRPISRASAAPLTLSSTSSSLAIPGSLAGVAAFASSPSPKAAPSTIYAASVASGTSISSSVSPGSW